MGGEVLYGAFCNCSNITSVTLLDGITSIGYCAFRDCGSLTSITIPSSITYIDSYAFDGCNGLDVVNITGLKAWCNISFDSVSSNPLYYAHNLYLNGELLTDIVIPEGVTRIGAYTFKGYKALTSIIIPSTVTSIDEGAFSGCSSLGSIALPFVGGSANAESESGSTLFGYIFGTSSYSGGTATEQSIRIIIAATLRV